VRLRAMLVGAGLIPPRTMHSDDDARVLRAAAAGRRRAVEIGVSEGSSAVDSWSGVDDEAEPKSAVAIRFPRRSTRNEFASATGGAASLRSA